jgi:serine/threonine protein kinase/Flp pilus assembly protein TadD
MGDTSVELDASVRRDLQSALRAAFAVPQPPPAASEPMEGDLQRERASYKMLGEIARGGMGVILRGRDAELTRDVAVKVLRSDLAGNESTVQRFLAEARIGGQLEHPGIVPVYEFGRMADRRPYIAMKLVQGRSLAELLAERATLTQDRHRYLSIFEQICQTMTYAHSRGVIHRDLKPANVMVGSFGEVQIVDWGLAKVLAQGKAAEAQAVAPSEAAPTASPSGKMRASTSHSVAGAVMGTPAYMPPEQARGEIERVDERSDVFALGAILCEILTGDPPCAGGSPAAGSDTAQAALAEARTRLDVVVEEPELAHLCLRCLSEERDHRPRGAGEVAAAIGAYLASIEERARAAQIAAAESRVKAEQERKARWLILGLASSILATLVLGGGGWLWQQHQRENRRTQTAELANAALDRASLLYGQVSDSLDPARWQEALAAVDRVGALLDAGEPSASLEQRTQELAQQIHSGAEAAERRSRLEASNRGLLARLQELRVPEGEGVDAPDWSRVDGAFAAAFREHDLDVDGAPPDDVARAIRERGLGVDVALSLDQWAAARRRAGKAEDAERLTSLALSADPDEARAGLRQALAQGDREELVRLCRNAKLESLPVATLTLLGNSLTAAGAEEEAVRVLRVAQRLRPDDFVSNVYLARLFWERDYQESARYYGAALAVKPDDRIVIHEFGYLLDHFLLEPDRAVALYRRGLERYPEDATLHLYLGLALADLGSYDEAVASLEAALRLEPRRVGPCIGLIKCAWSRGDLEAVIAGSHRTLDISPGNTSALGFLGLSRLKQGDLAGAAKALEEAGRLAPGDANIQEGLRCLFEAQGDPARALQAARGAVRYTDYLLDYFDRGMSLREIVDLDQAIGEHRAAVQSVPASAAQHCMLGVLLREKGLYSESLFELRVADALGADKGTWTLPSENPFGLAQRMIRTEHRCEQWIEDAQRLAELESRLERVLHGEDAPRDTAEEAELARLALRRERSVPAARMFASALADPSSASLPDWCRREAAAAGVLAGCGQGEGAAQLTSAERAELRSQAAQWMRADLEQRAEEIASGDPASRLRATQALSTWSLDSRLAGVRDAAAIAELPPEQGGTWRDLWSEVAGLEGQIRRAAQQPAK